jgi:hypothetical protein
VLQVLVDERRHHKTPTAASAPKIALTDSSDDEEVEEDSIRDENDSKLEENHYFMNKLNIESSQPCDYFQRLPPMKGARNIKEMEFIAYLMDMALLGDQVSLFNALIRRTSGIMEAAKYVAEYGSSGNGQWLMMNQLATWSPARVDTVLLPSTHLSHIQQVNQYQKLMKFTIKPAVKPKAGTKSSGKFVKGKGGANTKKAEAPQSS